MSSKRRKKMAITRCENTTNKVGEHQQQGMKAGAVRHDMRKAKRDAEIARRNTRRTKHKNEVQQGARTPTTRHESEINKA
jgi:hypothetical protein